MFKYLTPLVLVLACAGCAGGKVSIPTADALAIVAGAGACVESVNTAANTPACRAPIAPCNAAYQAGKAALDK